MITVLVRFFGFEKYYYLGMARNENFCAYYEAYCL